MYLPLAWVMNTGFFLFGIRVFVGVAMLRGLRGRRRWLRHPAIQRWLSASPLTRETTKG
jgi:hypothetical protein